MITSENWFILLKIKVFPTIKKKEHQNPFSGLGEKCRASSKITENKNGRKLDLKFLYGKHRKKLNLHIIRPLEHVSHHLLLVVKPVFPLFFLKSSYLCRRLCSKIRSCNTFAVMCNGQIDTSIPRGYSSFSNTFTLPLIPSFKLKTASQVAISTDFSQKKMIYGQFWQIIALKDSLEF